MEPLVESGEGPWEKIPEEFFITMTTVLILPLETRRDSSRTPGLGLVPKTNLRTPLAFLMSSGVSHRPTLHARVRWLRGWVPEAASFLLTMRD